MPTLIFLDSFDHYSNAQASRKWTSWGSAGITTGRTGQGGLTKGGIGEPGKTFGAEYAQLTAGIAYKTPRFTNEILFFKNVRGPGPFALLQHVGDGRLSIKFMVKGSPDTSSPSTFVMNNNQFYYFELQASVSSVDNGDGTSTVSFSATARVNENQILSHSANITITGAYDDVKFAEIRLGGPGGGDQATVDDLYVTDTEFLGDVQIAVLYPDGAGDLTQWTPLAGNNWENTKEHPAADDDTTYNSSDTVAQVDLYHLDDIGGSFSGTIKGVQSLHLVKKDDEGSGAVKGKWKHGVTTIDQGTNFFPSALGYLYNRQAERVSLFTAANWTQAEIDAMQLGIERTI